MYVLGISAFYHDSAACLLRDGEIIAAAQEERFTRKKHDSSLPVNAINFCLNEGGLSVGDLDCVAFYEKPFIKFDRLVETYLTFSPKGIRSFLKAIPSWMREKIWISEIIEKKLNYKGKILFTEHHEAHAASAFYPSPFNQAAIITLDGVGEWATTSFGIGRENRIKLLSEMKFPNSLGLLYSAFTYFTGFKVNSGEYKLMGLAPYGQPKYVDIIYKELIDLKDDGSFKLNLNYFDFPVGLRMTSRSFDRLFDGPPRKSESKITQREMDLARSIQDVTEEIILRMSKFIKEETKQEHLCLAGGVALNCVANSKLLNSKLFKDIWIQPAAGDAGGALGAAYVAYYHYFNKPAVIKRGKDLQKGSYLGPSYKDSQISEFLEKNNIPHQVIEKDDILNLVSDLLIKGKVIGWFQGKMEFGPRALGNRSIIGDARDPGMQRKINLKIKFRESFRPFAPSVLKEKVNEWFEINRESSYMLLVADVKKDKRIKAEDDNLSGFDKLNIPRSKIPAVTHVDYSARIQTVSKDDNPLFYNLISSFDNKTNCPVIVNTSFNVRGEPIVESPLDAYICFMRTEMDALVLGNFILYKEGQPTLSDIEWEKKYELD
jgi:carbamoyltransferase